MKFIVPKTFDVYFTINLFHSVIHESMVTIQAADENEAKTRANLKIYDSLQTLFRSAKNYDYSIWSIVPHGETIDAEVIKPKMIS